MDDFQHRLLVALERLAGREGGRDLSAAGGGIPSLGEQLGASREVLHELNNGLASLYAVLEEIRDRLADIAERLPAAPP